ncbi:MAG: hypothetical protein LBR78_01215 [Holosporales bacterium]|jgi:replication-associated recombination protein RarA|nr:hypothetical protein [Holosporales bacterium]
MSEMKVPDSTGIIIHGTCRNAVREAAYKFVISYLHSGDTGLSMAEVERHVLANTYPNFFSVKSPDDKAESSIDDIRRIIAFMSQTRYANDRMAVLIECAESMSRNAANALLKVLEEPQSDSIIVLTTTKLFAMLPTIRSRCIKIQEASRSTLSAHSDPARYVRVIMEHIDEAFVDTVVGFIESGCQDIVEFAKVNAERMTDFIDVLSAYCSFACFKMCDASLAEAVLELHSFANLARHTSPDKQAAIIAAYSPLSKP